MKKIGNIILFCSLCILLLTSCGTAEKSEKELQADVQAEDFMLYNYDLEVEEFEIIKRQTNDDDKQDFVWCSVQAENEYFTYENEFELEYVLYNDGWILEESNINRNMRAYTLKENVVMVDENTLVRDIGERDDFFDTYGLEIISTEIYDVDIANDTGFHLFSDAEWDWDAKSTGYWNEIYYSDGIYKMYRVDIKAENDEFIYYNNYIVTYMYDYDVWELYDVMGVDSKEYEVLNYEEVSQMDADAIISTRGYDYYTLSERSEDGENVVFSYYAKTEEYYLVSEYTVDIYYSFTPENGWKQGAIKETIDSQMPDLVGEWSYTKTYSGFATKSTYSYYVNILDVTYDSQSHAGKLIFEYDVDYDGKNYSSNGVRIEELEKSNSVQGKIKLDNCLFDTWGGVGGEIYMGFSVGEMSQITGSGIFVGNYFLEKIS